MRCTDEPGGIVTYSWSDGRHLHLVTAQLPRERLRPIALEVERAVSMTPPRVARVEVVSSAADEARHWRRPGR